MSNTVRPTFKDAAEQSEWFLQDGLRRRLQQHSEIEKRGSITVIPRFSDIQRFLSTPQHSITIMIDDKSDVNQVLDKMYLSLCESGIEESQFQPQILMSGAWGNNRGSISGVNAPCDTDAILKTARSMIETAKSEGLLTPKDVKFQPEFLAKFEKSSMP